MIIPRSGQKLCLIGKTENGGRREGDWEKKGGEDKGEGVRGTGGVGKRRKRRKGEDENEGKTEKAVQGQ